MATEEQRERAAVKYVPMGGMRRRRPGMRDNVWWMNGGREAKSKEREKTKRRGREMGGRDTGRTCEENEEEGSETEDVVES